MKQKKNVGLRVGEINKPSLNLKESEKTEKSGIIFSLYLLFYSKFNKMRQFCRCIRLITYKNC